jgi:hypothetical protein
VPPGQRDIEVATSIFAGASLTPQFPVACRITAAVTFTPPLTMAGTITTNKNAVTPMAVTGGLWNGCLSAASPTAPTKGVPVDQTINLPATKLGTKLLRHRLLLFVQPRQRHQDTQGFQLAHL